tara:strand:+ start:2126 stop:2683 length:558 start_codon:yes stop_codon:yes gene_type:complete
MATAYLNPASATVNTNWDSSDVTELVQGETSNTWITTANNANLTVTLSDFDNTGVASIDSVQVILVGKYGGRSGSWTAQTRIYTSAGNLDESLSIPAGRTVSTVTGTVQTTSDGSAAWTDGNLDEMTLRVYSSDCAALGQMVQLYIKVEYTETSGYGNTVNGVAAASIGEVKGVATANIEKVIGV